MCLLDHHRRHSPRQRRPALLLGVGLVQVHAVRGQRDVQRYVYIVVP